MSYQQPPQAPYPNYGQPFPPQYPPAAPPYPGSGPFPTGDSIDDAKKQVKGAIRARRRTDRTLSSLWIIIPIIISIGSSIAGITLILYSVFSGWTFDPYSPYDPFISTPNASEYLAGLAIMMIGGFVSTVIFSMLVFHLVTRQNEHSKRESQLRMGMLSLMKSAARSPEMQSYTASEIATINSLHSQGNMEERQRSPITWTLVILIPGILSAIGGMLSIAFFDQSWDIYSATGLMGLSSLISLIDFVMLILVLYLAYFLMKNNYEHDYRWHVFTQQTHFAMNKLGYQIPPPYWAPLPNRSFVIYLVLSIITLGLFGLYWIYVLIKDPNDHYKNQRYFEDLILPAIGE